MTALERPGCRPAVGHEARKGHELADGQGAPGSAEVTTTTSPHTTTDAAGGYVGRDLAPRDAARRARHLGELRSQGRRAKDDAADSRRGLRVR
jgi:hypothetical protein